MFQAVVDVVYNPENPDQKDLVKKKLLETTKVMYWFGVACTL